MNAKLKTEILNAMKDILEKNQNNCQNVIDLFNVTKIIEDYDELEPKLRKILNEKARKDKWGER